MGVFDRLLRKEPQPTDRSRFHGLRYQDLEVCDLIAKTGLALDEPVHAVFFLFLASKNTADATAAALGARGLKTSVKEPWVEGDVRNDRWTVTGESRTNALIPDFLRDTIDACEAIAAEHGGEYDGWEAGPADGELKPAQADA